jgi:dienelactone hydrolase
MSSSDKVLAGPSAACCLRGTIHTGSPSGAVSEIAGVETYIATPPTGKANGNIVLYFPDVFGLFTNGQLIMDGFAEAGYLVFGPDYFRGVRC